MTFVVAGLVWLLVSPLVAVVMGRWLRHLDAANGSDSERPPTLVESEPFGVARTHGPSPTGHTTV